MCGELSSGDLAFIPEQANVMKIEFESCKTFSGKSAAPRGTSFNYQLTSSAPTNHLLGAYIKNKYQKPISKTNIKNQHHVIQPPSLGYMYENQYC